MSAAYWQCLTVIFCRVQSVADGQGYAYGSAQRKLVRGIRLWGKGKSFRASAPLLDSDIEIYTKSSRNYEQHYLDNCFICGFNIFT